MTSKVALVILVLAHLLRDGRPAPFRSAKMDEEESHILSEVFESLSKYIDYKVRNSMNANLKGAKEECVCENRREQNAIAEEQRRTEEETATETTEELRSAPTSTFSPPNGQDGGGGGLKNEENPSTTAEFGPSEEDSLATTEFGRRREETRKEENFNSKQWENESTLASEEETPSTTETLKPDEERSESKMEEDRPESTTSSPMTINSTWKSAAEGQLATASSSIAESKLESTTQFLPGESPAEEGEDGRETSVSPEVLTSNVKREEEITTAKTVEDQRDSDLIGEDLTEDENLSTTTWKNANPSEEIILTAESSTELLLSESPAEERKLEETIPSTTSQAAEDQLATTSSSTVESKLESTTQFLPDEWKIESEDVTTVKTVEDQQRDSDLIGEDEDETISSGGEFDPRDLLMWDNRKVVVLGTTRAPSLLPTSTEATFGPSNEEVPSTTDPETLSANRTLDYKDATTTPAATEGTTGAEEDQNFLRALQELYEGAKTCGNAGKAVRLCKCADVVIPIGGPENKIYLAENPETPDVQELYVPILKISKKDRSFRFTDYTKKLCA